MLKTYSKLLQNTIRTITNWKNENRPIISLLEKYYTKEDLEEFLITGQVSKYERIDKNFICDRLLEIVSFFSKNDTETLKNALINALLKNNINSGTVQYLKQKRQKLDVIKRINNLLNDYLNEKKEQNRYISDIANIQNDEKCQSWHGFELSLSDFNKMIDFNFDLSDRVIIENIILKYKVYNTLYDLDKAPKD